MEKRIEKFLVNSGLYGEGLNISVADLEELKVFFEGEYKLNVFCIECNAERVFTAEVKPQRKSIGEPTKANIFDKDSMNKKEFEALTSRYPDFRKKFTCTMDEVHSLTFCCLINNNHLIKYGQYPSLADINNTNTKKYRKILGKKYSDYNRGIGLHAHGVGAGSLVYLRRIFEDLIEEAHNNAKNESGWNEESYPNRMDEKIKVLKDFLPEYLVDNRSIYGILSKGIHELPEDLCTEIFPTVRVGIEFILDEKIEKEERERKKKETASLLQTLSARVNN